MRCPKCGNEVSQDEAFCGQCGTPVTPAGHATEMVQAPRSGLANTYNPNQPYLPPTLPNAYNSGNPSPAPGGSMAPPNQPPLVRPPGPQQQTGFYQEPTEAISALPDNNAQGYPANYPQRGFAGTPAQGGYTGSQVQPFQAGGYTRHGYQQMPTSQAG